ncbi:MAG: hypothetical protein ACYCV1_08705 [Acidimicrobiales bacterium]
MKLAIWESNCLSTPEIKIEFLGSLLKTVAASSGERVRLGVLMKCITGPALASIRLLLPENRSGASKRVRRTAADAVANAILPIICQGQ